MEVSSIVGSPTECERTELREEGFRPDDRYETASVRCISRGTAAFNAMRKRARSWRDVTTGFRVE